MKYQLTDSEISISQTSKASFSKTRPSWKDPNRAKEYERIRHLKRHYNLTPEEFDSLFQSQGCGCACCGTKEHKAKAWHIDHDHKTNRIRGILCGPCNISIGINGDSLEKVEKALQQQTDYLRRAQCEG